MAAETGRSPYAPPQAEIEVELEKTPRPIAVMLLQGVLLLQLIYLVFTFVWAGIISSGWSFSGSRGVWLSFAVFAAYGAMLLTALVGLTRRSFWGRWLSFVGLFGFACLFLVIGISGLAAEFSLAGSGSEYWRFALFLTGLGLLFLLWTCLVVFSRKARRFYGATA